MTDQGVWFSHREKIYKVTNGRFIWTDKDQIWDWDHCTTGLVRTLENKLIVVVRSSTNKNSRFMGNKPVELRFMLGFQVNGFSEPRTESYTARDNHPDPGKREGPGERWVIQLDSDYWIWEWAKEGVDIRSSHIYGLYKQLQEEISHPSIQSDNIFDIELDVQDDRIIPVVYQPAVDSLDNFVREVHCARSEMADGSIETEVTLIFNNEQLRKHAYGGIINKIYEGFRRLYHGRILDIETCKIIGRKEDNKLIFENIYSNKHQLDEDSIHGDPPMAPKRDIKYYFIDQNHPVIFINTSNHAMAEYDTNHRIWKWEYIPWADNAPIKLGSKTRKKIEKQFKPILKFW